MFELKKLAKQSSHYFGANVIGLFASFVSFPIFTRVFSVEDYGTLSLVSVTLFLAVAMGKLGIQNSLVRFYQEFKLQKRQESITQFYSTFLLGSAIACSIVFLLSWFTIRLIGYTHFMNQFTLGLLCFALLLVPLRCLHNILTSFLRAEQRTKILSLLQLAKGYTSLLLCVFFTLYFIKGLYGYYSGMIIAESVFLVILLWMLLEKQEISYKYFSPDFFMESVKYGLPLVAVELGHNILNLGDRYLIQYFLDSKSVGLYSAAYNLANYLSDIFKYPLLYAIFPIYMEIWTNEGREKTQLFLSKTLSYFLLIIIPVTFGFIAIGKELMTFLASDKYASSYVVIPYILIGLTLYSAHGVLSAGLHISKKTHLIAFLIVFSTLLNTILNIILIPWLQIVGAAIATLIAYGAYIVLLVIYSFKELSFRVEFSRIFRYILFSGFMFFIVKNVYINTQFLNLLCKIGAGIISYSLLLSLFDKEIRTWIIEMTKDAFSKIRAET